MPTINRQRSRLDSLPEAASVNGQSHREGGIKKLLPGINNNGENATGNQHKGVRLAHGRDDNGWCYCYLKEKCSILEEMPVTHQDSLPILGIIILERLARDLDNC